MKELCQEFKYSFAQKSMEKVKQTAYKIRLLTSKDDTSTVILSWAIREGVEEFLFKIL